MNRQETGGVLAVLTATWPKHELADETAAVWASQLQRTLVVDALEAAAHLARSDEWFPSLARFIETCQQQARRRALDEAHRSRELESDNSPIVSNEEGLEWVRRVRRTVAEARANSPVPSVPGLRTVGQTLVEQF